MDGRHLALLTRQLIALAGGLDESTRACRLKKSRLSQCQDEDLVAFLPIDVVHALEVKAGVPVISRALVENVPVLSDQGDLVAEACRTSEEGSDLQRLVREAQQAGLPVSRRQAREIERDLLALIDQVRRVHCSLLVAEAAR